MADLIPATRSFSFVRRPLPVPGDFRINWRLSVILLMLGNSRAKRASLAKLHLLNDAVQLPNAAAQLERILAGAEHVLNWQVRVEPAFGRAIDFVVGERFAGWIQRSGRAGLQLTDSGAASYESIAAADGVLMSEKVFLQANSRKVTEAFVSKVLAASGGN